MRRRGVRWLRLTLLMRCSRYATAPKPLASPATSRWSTRRRRFGFGPSGVGEILQEMSREGALGKGKCNTLSHSDIERHESSRWQRVASVPDQEFERYVAETKADGRQLTSSGVRKLAEQSAPEQRIYRRGPRARALSPRQSSH